MPKKKQEVLPSPYTGLSPGEIWPMIREKYPDQTKKILDMLIAGSSRDEICAETGIRRSTVGLTASQIAKVFERLSNGEPLRLGQSLTNGPRWLTKEKTKTAASDIEQSIWSALRSNYDEVNQRIMDLAMKGNSMSDIAGEVEIPASVAAGRYASIKKSIKKIADGGILYGVQLHNGEISVLPPMPKVTKASRKDEAGAWSGDDDGGPGVLDTWGSIGPPTPTPLQLGLIICDWPENEEKTLAERVDGFKVPDALTQEAFGQLTDFHQQLLLMHNNDGLSAMAISSKLGLQTQTVTSALKTAHDTLAEIVKHMSAYLDARAAKKIETSLAEKAPPNPFRTERVLNDMLAQGVYSPTEVNKFVLDVIWTMGGKKIGPLRTSVDQIFNLAKQRHELIRRGQVEAALRTLRIQSMIECRDALDGNYTLTDRTAKAVLSKNGIPGLTEPTIQLEQPSTGTMPEDTKELAMTPPVESRLEAPANTIEAYIQNQLEVLTAAAETVTLRSRCQTLESELMKAREAGMELDQDDFLQLDNAIKLLANLTDIAKDSMGSGMLELLFKRKISAAEIEDMHVVLAGIHAKGRPKP